MRTLLKLLILATFLAGCATTPPPAERAADPAAQAKQALVEGDFETAIREFIRLAAESPTPKRQEYQLLAAEAMLGNKDAQAAQQLLQRIDIDVLPKPLQARHQLLAAQAALALRDSERALAVLAVPLAPHTEPAWHARFHELRAQAYALAERHIESARALMQRRAYLRDGEALQANRQAIWTSLSMVSAKELQAFPLLPPPDELSGWVELAHIGKQYQASPEELTRLLANWRLRYPTHPADEELLDSLITRIRELAVQPTQLAVLLPLSGKYANAAKAVLEGILAAYYDTAMNTRILIKVYDVGEDPTRAPYYYNLAIAEGAELVIGPLSKEAVTALAEQDELSVPTLALNATDEPRDIDNLFQFTLSPEDEARQVAEHAWLLGYSHAAVFTPRSAWGTRIYSAFDERWQELGGRVVSRAEYNARESDFSTPLQAMLNVRDSKQRHRQLEALLKSKLEFIPHRRQDIDFVFIAGFPRQARLIRPQLKFHHASGLPVLSTSHVFSGKIERNKDRDMDDIEFGDMPWTLLNGAVPTTLGPANLKFLQQRSLELQRFIALGVDAYQLIPVLKVLAHFPYERYQGVTGVLSIDEHRRVQRRIRWAQFQGGVPRLQQVHSNVENPTL